MRVSTEVRTLRLVVTLVVAGLLLGLVFRAGTLNDSTPDQGAAQDLVGGNLPLGSPLSKTLSFLHSAKFSAFTRAHGYSDPTICTHDYMYKGCDYEISGQQFVGAARKKCLHCAILNATLNSSDGKTLTFWFVFDRSNHLTDASLDGYSPSF